jgi:hypothetical protein
MKNGLDYIPMLDKRPPRWMRSFRKKIQKIEFYKKK